MRIFGLPQNGWVWLGGCGFGLTTLNELAPGLSSVVFCERAAKAGIPRNLKQSGDKVQLLSHM